MPKPSHPTSNRPEQASVPAAHALHLARAIERWGIRPEQLLAQAGLTEAMVAEPAARISMPTVERLIERARRLTGESGLGFYLGLQMPVAAHGFLGFAAMTSQTVGEALALAARFAPTRTMALGLHYHVEGADAALVIEEQAPFGSARDVIIIALFVAIWTIGKAITGQDLRGSADVTFPEPDYFSRFIDVTPGPVRFEQPVNQLVFDAAILNLPVMMADPAAQRLAREQCERELDALGGDDRIATRVRAVVQLDQGRVSSLNEVASRLHVSTRSLKRKLAAEGTTYSELVDTLRRQRAALMLRSGRLSVEEVALRLGYADPANFTRAFRRWTGMSPRAFRRSESTVDIH